MREGLLILLTEDYYSYAGRITNPPRVGLGGIQNRGATLSKLRPDCLSPPKGGWGVLT